MDQGVNLTTLLFASVGAGGLGAVLREIFTGLAKLMGGVAAREGRRKSDVATARDNAERREAFQRARADAAERNVFTLRDTLAETRRGLLEMGVARQDLPPIPELEETLSRADIDRIIEEEQQ
jgi:hypothetical protein